MALFVCEPRFQECPHNLQRGSRTDNAGPETEHIHVVMFNALMTRVCIVRDACPDTFDLIRCHTCADSTATDKDSALNLT